MSTYLALNYPDTGHTVLLLKLHTNDGIAQEGWGKSMFVAMWNTLEEVERGREVL